MDTQQVSAPSRAPSAGVVHINIRLTDGYTIISNRLSQHRGMSLLAIGLGTHIQSLPDGRRVGVKALAAVFPESETRIAAALRELEQHGFLRRTRERVGGGKLATRTESYNHPEAAARRGTRPAPVPVSSGSAWPRRPSASPGYCAVVPAERETAGLLALLLLVHARRDARTGPDGEPVLLEEQDRGRWDRAMIEEGRGLVVRALTGGPAGPYGVQAAIAALHDEAADVESTDWAQIVALYDVLFTLAPSPVVAVNRAVAVAMRDGPGAGLALLDALAGEPRLRAYPPYAVARGDLLTRLGRAGEAAEAYRQALEQAGTEPERAALRRKLGE
ncbi:hypothetical protein SBADM41S_10616 [Streptomyces badius]